MTLGTLWVGKLLKLHFREAPPMCVSWIPPISAVTDQDETTDTTTVLSSGRLAWKVQVLRSGPWHITVDVPGLRGTVCSSIRQLPSVITTAQEAPLSSVPSLVRDPMSTPKTDEDKEFDVFISHASEDKEGGGMTIFN